MTTPEWTFQQVILRVFDNLKNALRVLVVNDNSNPIPVTIAGTIAGTPYFEDFDGAHPAGIGPHVLLSMTVPPTKTRTLEYLKVACRQEAAWQVTQNGNVIANLRTGAARPSDSFEWKPSRPCAAGDTIEVVLTKRSGSSDTDVGAHLSGVET